MYDHAGSSTFYNPVPLQLARPHLQVKTIARMVDAWWICSGKCWVYGIAVNGKGKDIAARKELVSKKELYGTRLWKTQVISNVK